MVLQLNEVYCCFWHHVLWGREVMKDKLKATPSRGSRVKWNETRIYCKLRELKAFELLRNWALGLQPLIGCPLDRRNSQVLLQVVGWARNTVFPGSISWQFSSSTETERWKVNTYTLLAWFPVVSSLQQVSMAWDTLSHDWSMFINRVVASSEL